MLSSIDETAEDSLERPNSVVQRLNVVDSKKCSLPEFIGKHGPYQYRQWLVYFVASTCSSMYLFSTFPLSAQLSCMCNRYQNVSTSGSTLFSSVVDCAFSNCQMDSSLKDHGVNSSCASSFGKTDQEDVRCANMKVVIYAKYVYLLGVVLSAFTASTLSFKFGRRLVAVISGFLLLGFSIATGVSYSLVNYLILRLFVSITVMNVYFISIFSLVECLGEEYRMLYGLTGHVGWGMSHFVLPLVTSMTSNWLQYNAVFSCACAPLIILSFFIPESIANTAATGLRAKSQKLIRIAAWRNGCPTDDLEIFAHELCHKENQKETMKQVSKTANIKRASELSLLFLVGFSASFLYFACLGLSDWVSRDRGGFFALAGTTEVSAALVCLFFTCVISSKNLWSVATVISSVFLLILYAKTSHNEYFYISRSTFLVAMFFASLCWTTVLMRTLFRPLGSSTLRWNAFISGFAIVCGALIASLTDMQKFDAWSPKYYVVYAIPNLTIGAAIGIVPERYFSF